ncbi:hypothetical protein EDB82DRAFT_501538 [Fusarium venenatum]|uniref:uncharacterized protein n=1 Tax=Fusarium venenatum TaxID=56646 RepID=UPI001D8E8738|nr:hypothetical protein EDB82DRAFT_501538 [Fusarium venenatum]
MVWALTCPGSLPYSMAMISIMALTSHKTSRSQRMMMILLSISLPLVATFILAPKNPEGRFDNGSTTDETVC